MAEPTSVLLILLIAAFLPPLFFLGVIRKTERFGREPLGRVLRTFLWGAIFAVIIAVILSVILIYVFQAADRLNPQLIGRDPRIELILLAIVIAPFTEEFAKGVGVFLARPMIKEPEDGIVYGAASGLGFAASENLLYALVALAATGSVVFSLIVVGLRSISSALLHASASATFGYGIGRNRIRPQEVRILPYYLLAVGMHAGFNILASLSELFTGPEGESAALIGLFGAIALAVVAFALIRARIVAEDDRTATY